MSRYNTDYYAWTQEMADALRTGNRLDREDLQFVAEELEDLGRSEKRSLKSAIAQLYLHLLKKRYQPDLETVSWEVSVEKQRDEIEELIHDNPSLKPLLVDGEFLAKAYRAAVQDAVRETKLPKTTFPARCPFSYTDFGLPSFKKTSEGQYLE